MIKDVGLAFITEDMLVVGRDSPVESLSRLNTRTTYLDKHFVEGEVVPDGVLQVRKGYSLLDTTLCVLTFYTLWRTCYFCPYFELIDL